MQFQWDHPAPARVVTWCGVAHGHMCGTHCRRAGSIGHSVTREGAFHGAIPAGTPAPPEPPAPPVPPLTLHEKITATLLDFGYAKLNELHEELQQAVDEVDAKVKSLAVQVAASSLTAEILRYDHMRRQARNDTVRFVAVALTLALVVMCMLTWDGETLKSLFGRAPVVSSKKPASTPLKERLGILVALSNRAQISVAVKRCANRLMKVASNSALRTSGLGPERQFATCGSSRSYAISFLSPIATRDSSQSPSSDFLEDFGEGQVPKVGRPFAKKSAKVCSCQPPTFGRLEANGCSQS
jgi:hypothetical protein